MIQYEKQKMEDYRMFHYQYRPYSIVIAKSGDSTICTVTLGRQQDEKYGKQLIENRQQLSEELQTSNEELCTTGVSNFK